MSNLQTLLALVCYGGMTVLLTVLSFTLYYNYGLEPGMILTLSTLITIGLFTWNLTTITRKLNAVESASLQLPHNTSIEIKLSIATLLYYFFASFFFIYLSKTAFFESEFEIGWTFVIIALIPTILFTWGLITTLRQLKAKKQTAAT